MTSKKNFSPVIVALSVIGEMPLIDQVQLEAPQVLDAGGVGRAPEEAGKLAHRANVVLPASCAASLRMRMSSIMRWRNGLMPLSR